MRTLHSKFSLALLALLCLAGIGFIPLFTWTARQYNAEVSQHLNRSLASHLAQNLAGSGLFPPDFASNPRVQKRAAAQISSLMVLNPDIEIYCLDEDGRVLLSSAHGAIAHPRVDLDPVRRFLAGVGPLPLRGDDPRDARGQKVFSVAPIPAGRDDRKRDGQKRLRGFVYIILAGQQHDLVAAPFGRSLSLRLGAQAVACGLALVFIAGALMFFGLTRRVRHLAREVEAFGTRSQEGKDLGIPLFPAPSLLRYSSKDDDVDKLEQGFVLMATRIREQVQKLERSDEYRREAVSNVSHDLRTPLAALQGYLETLLMKEDSLGADERRAYLQTATRHSQRLGKLVSELFELAKLDSGELQLHLEVFSLAELVQDVVLQFEHRAREAGVRLETRFEQELPFVRADIGLIERALENLLDNALHHTPSGGSVIVAILMDKAARSVSVRIQDSGTGIAPDVLPLIFERHYRGQKRAQGEEADGAGLGLAITRRIAQLHGGGVSVQSEVGRGSRFDLSLPLHL